MDRGLALAITLVIGGLIAIQPATNAMLARHTGALVAALASLLIASAIIAVFLVAAGDLPRLAGLAEFRPVHLLGGIAGAAVVGGSIVLIRSLGAAALTAALVTMQLIVSVAMDRAGWFGVDQLPVGLTTLLGVGFLIAGTLLVAAR